MRVLVWAYTQWCAFECVSVSKHVCMHAWVWECENEYICVIVCILLCPCESESVCEIVCVHECGSMYESV